MTTPTRPEPHDPVDPPEPAEEAATEEGAGRPCETFPVVGVGAGAGGVEAFAAVLDHLPVDLGVAFVFVSAHAVTREGGTAAALARHTQMPVVEVSEATTIVANRVYVAPPELGVRDGTLIPPPPGEPHGTPIDRLFAALALDCQNCAIGLVLSGAGADGVLGLREIKGVGGITIVQDPDTARHDGMPRAAIAAGVVDLVCPAAEIAEELQRLGRHPYVRRAAPRRIGDDLVIHHEQLHRVFTLLRGASGVDFTHYKPPTIRRRLQRRMVLHKLDSVEQYIKFMRESPEEVLKLYQDLLIHVTRFFRDADSFKALVGQVFPRLLQSRRGIHPLRIWLPGCSTGEEAYSVAIALLEFLGDDASGVPIQIFATDVSETAIELARNGVYPETIAGDVSPERLRRFFSPDDGRYRVAKVVRDLCVFARQDVTRDPPFSKLDLILCRNVLIYLGAVLQHKLMTVFHYALKPSGFLMLGGAETVGAQTDLFAVVDKKHRIFSRKQVDTPAHVQIPLEYTPGASPGRSPRMTVEVHAGHTVQAEANRLILERYGPPGVVVDEDFQVVQFRGKTGYYLEPAPGDATQGLDLLKMAREGLLHGLQTALYAARKTGAPVHKPGLRVAFNGHGRVVDLQVVPFTAAGLSRHYLVIFEDITDAADSRPSPAAVPVAGDDERVRQLQDELAASREYLQSIIQDLEAANEELQSANEEILSSNEELQSTNEELDTAKEELQSTNEELSTVNEELHGRNDELSRVNSDLINLLGCVEIAIVIVGADLGIRRFTPMAEKVLNLIPTDIGRPISQIKPNIECPGLEKLIARVIDTVTIHETNVRDSDGHWYSLRIRPYKNVENRIDGAVLALFDIASRRPDNKQRQARDHVRAVLDTVPVPVVVLDGQHRVQRINRPFAALFQVAADAAVHRSIYDLHGGRWGGPRLRTLLEEVLPHEGRVDGYRLDGAFPGVPAAIVSAGRIDGEDDATIVLVLQDVAGTRGHAIG